MTTLQIFSWISDTEIKSIEDCNIQSKFNKKMKNAVMGEKNPQKFQFEYVSKI